MDNLAILINSCDSYSDAWYPFFRIMEKTWPEAKNYKLYLNTETKKYVDSFFDIITINQIGKQRIHWGERLRNCLGKIKEKYILFLLEDFFFEYVDNQKITDAFSIIKKTELIDSISFISTYDCENNNHFFEYDNCFVYRKKKAYFKLNASPTIYKKVFLQKYTFSKDSPWYWEFFGSVRTWHSRGIHLAKAAHSNSIFEYDIKHGGAIHRGKWVGVSTRKILLKHGIDIDLDERGVIEDWLVSNPEKPKHNIFTIFKNRFLLFFNYFLSFFLR